MKISNIEVKDELINNALIGAREGACNYWAQSRLFTQKRDKFLGEYISDLKTREKLWENKEYTKDRNKPIFQSFFEIPDDGGKPEIELFVTHEAIQRGLKLMAEKHPKHFANLMGETDDAFTHDVFLQLCLLGDIVYG